MSEPHVIDLSANPARVSFETGCIRIESVERVMRIPPIEIGAIVLAHPQVIITQAAMAELANNGAIVVTCDRQYLPVSITFPLGSHHLHTQRVLKQAQASLPLRKRAWQQLVTAKIAGQSALLHKLHNNDYGLNQLASDVQSGDKTNREAQASRIYWKILFGEDFKRRHDDPGVNALLNYGYTVLRAAVARGICAAGLHPSFGVGHHNRYNAFCLADDFIEPFRPIVDSLVVGYVAHHGIPDNLEPQEKKAMMAILEAKFLWTGESRGLFDTVHRVAVSYWNIINGKSKALELPSIEPNLV